MMETVDHYAQGRKNVKRYLALQLRKLNLTDAYLWQAQSFEQNSVYCIKGFWRHGQANELYRRCMKAGLTYHQAAWDEDLCWSQMTEVDRVRFLSKKRDLALRLKLFGEHPLCHRFPALARSSGWKWMPLTQHPLDQIGFDFFALNPHREFGFHWDDPPSLADDEGPRMDGHSAWLFSHCSSEGAEIVVYNLDRCNLSVMKNPLSALNDCELIFIYAQPGDLVLLPMKYPYELRASNKNTQALRWMMWSERSQISSERYYAEPYAKYVSRH